MHLRNHLLFPVVAVILSMRSMDALTQKESFETERIIGGSKAARGQFPYACALFKDGSITCTCSIIGPTTVLTAAHCVSNGGNTESVNKFHAIANISRRAAEVRIDFASLTAHPDYSENNVVNDIAVFRTTKLIPFSSDVNQACITRNDTLWKDNPIAMGYGDTTRTRLVASEDLNYVEQKIRNNTECRRYYGGGQMDDCKICAEGNFTGICNGDSGGPLAHYRVNNRDIQIGVASYGTSYAPCGSVTPAVWCRVSCYIDFILSVAEGDAICVE